MGGACEKKPNKPNDTGAIAALDQAAGGSTAATGPADTTPLTGIDISKLEGDKSATFYRLVNSLQSPCGKAHSLRTSFSTDTTCKRASFAVRYVVALLEDEANETQARKAYEVKYTKTPKTVKLDVSKAPREGAEDGQIKLVEFFDYECPHCALFKPELDQVLASKGSQVSLYLMMYPIESKHPDARSAAQAALAASKLGKFKEMHAKLFAESPRHNRDQVAGYAKELGLDAAAFAKAYDEANAQVTADREQGDAAEVDSTPTLFFNGRKYEGPMMPRYIEMWIDEEIAVNR